MPQGQAYYMFYMLPFWHKKDGGDDDDDQLAEFD